MIGNICIFGLLGVLFVLPLSWRQCVKLALFAVVIEGAIRKWVLPGASQFVYFFKDFLVLAAYLKFFSARATASDDISGAGRVRVLTSWIMAFVFFQALNPNLGSPVLGLIGARNYLLYIPLVYLVGDLFRTREELVSFLERYLLLVIPVSLLAVKQHMSPPESAWNIYARSEESGLAMIGTAVRVTGTFSYIAGFSSYLQTMAALTVPLLVVELPPRWKWSIRIVFPTIVSAIVLTGSRAPLVIMIAFGVLYFLLNRDFRRLRLYTKFSVPVVFVAGIFIVALAPILDEIAERGSSGQDLLPRMTDTITQPFKSLPEVGLFGYGAGSAYQARDIIRKMFDLPEGNPIPVFLESEPQRIMYEIGPIGFILWYLLRIELIIALWRTYCRLTVPLYRELALTACLVHLTGLNSQMVFQITFMVYYWFLTGFILLLPRLEREEAFERRRQLRQRPAVEPRPPTLEPGSQGAGVP